jgi:hypothetical protein
MIGADMLALLVNSVIVALGSGLVALALSVGPGVRVIATLLLAQAWITCVLLLSGVGLQRLDATAITAVNLAIALAVVIGCRRHMPRLAAGIRAAPGAVRSWIGGLRGSIVRRPAIAIVGAVVGAGLAWKLAQALRLPTLDYDGFSYHLVTVDVWLQGGAIGRVPQRIWSDGYPANGELITLWLMAFTRSDMLANLTAFLAVPLAMAATAGLARTLGATRDRAILAGLVIGGTPAVLALSASTYVDSWAMADVAAAAVFGALAVRSGRTGSPVPFVLAGVAIGLAVGTKASMAIPMATIAAALVLASTRAAGTWPDRARAAARTAVLVAVPALALGGYWYLKNLLVFGDPFWPFTLGPFHGIGDFGLITQTPAGLAGDPEPVAILRSWFADFGARSYLYDTQIGGFGLVWALLLVLAVVGIARTERAVRGYIAALGAAMLVTLLTMPMGWWPRLTLFFVVLVAALAAVGVSRLPRLPNRVVVAVIVVLVSLSVQVTVGRSNLLPGLDSRQPPAVTLARIMAAGDPLRVDIGLWGVCSRVTGLPKGARVAVDSFALVHAVIGHALDRTSLPPMDMSADPKVLAQRLHLVGATHLILAPWSVALPGVTDRPDLFPPLGQTCRAAQVFEVSPGAP